MMRENRKGKLGFTLIELLIVSVLMSVISLALYATFGSGIKIWQKISQAVVEEDAHIFLSKFKQDLSNSVRFSGINFSGDKQEMRLGALVYSPQLALRSVGELVYSYNSGTLNRKERDFSQIYNGQEGFYESVVENLKFCKFAYYGYDKEAKEYVWKDEWIDASLPLAVRLEFEFKDKTKGRRFVQTVDIPIGG